MLKRGMGVKYSCSINSTPIKPRYDCEISRRRSVRVKKNVFNGGRDNRIRCLRLTY